MMYHYNRIVGLWLACLTVGLLVGSCKGIQKERIIYSNDFEGKNIDRISGAKVESYNGSNVLGRYSENGFVLKLTDIKSHDMIQISFDLYIHDSWDGNISSADGPDIWIMNIDGWSSVYATFANGLCTTCTQSYPVTQPTFANNKPVFFNNLPNSNAIRTDLPGACLLKDTKGGTSMYRIVRTFNHTGATLEVGCFSQQEDPDPANKNCKESWSVDNIQIKTIQFD